jgi:hypothetical protein
MPYPGYGLFAGARASWIRLCFEYTFLMVLCNPSLKESSASENQSDLSHIEAIL